MTLAHTQFHTFSEVEEIREMMGPKSLELEEEENETKVQLIAHQSMGFIPYH